jgi:hypothetical protein
MIGFAMRLRPRVISFKDVTSYCELGLSDINDNMENILVLCELMWRLWSSTTVDITVAKETKLWNNIVVQFTRTEIVMPSTRHQLHGTVIKHVCISCTVGN